MSDGFILLHRKIINEGWSDNPNVLSLAIHLMMMANHTPKKIIFNKQEIVINRGQILTGRKKLSVKTGLSEQSIRTSLKILENTEFLTIKVTNKFSLITLCKYDYYQDMKNFFNQQVSQRLTINQPSTNQQLTTNKELKECIKNEKELKEEKHNEKINYDFFMSEWNQKFPQFKIQCLTDDRKKKIKTRLQKNKQFISDFILCFERIEQSSFLLGEKNDWSIDFDWLIKNDTNYRRVLEGKYASKPKESLKERADRILKESGFLK